MNTTIGTTYLYTLVGITVLACFGNCMVAAEVPPLLATLNGPDYLVTVDRVIAFGTRIGHLGIGFDDAMTALEYDSVHHILYGAVSGSTPDLFTVDPSTGLATRVGDPGTLGILATGMTYDPINDVLYAAGGDRYSRKNLYTINRVTGSSTLLGEVAGISDSIQGLGFDPQTNTLYGLDEFSPTGARVVTIDTTTFVATPLTGNINPAQNGWNGLAFDPFTGDLFVNSNTTLYRINPTTKDVTTVGLTYSPNLNTYGSLTVMAPYLVPEPTTPIVFILGALMLFARRRISVSRSRRACSIHRGASLR